MGLLDSILNLAGLLLWLNWRSFWFDPLSRTTPATLVGTLRRAEPRRFRRVHLLAALAVLLLLRGLFYWQIGAEVNWTPKLDLGVVALVFPTELAPGHMFRSMLPMLLYSSLSFLRVLVVFYFWLLTLVLLNRETAEPAPIHKMLRLQLGRIVRWPWPAQCLLPLVLVTILWLLLHPLLVGCDVTSPVRSLLHLVEQGLLVSAGLYFSLKYLLPALLLLYLVASYVYLGSNPFWDFVASTAGNLLAPLHRFPLRIAKFDFAPVVAALVILLLLHAVPDYLVPWLLKTNLALWLWPQ